MFLRFRSEELNNHSINPDWWLASDYAPLTITILITEEHIQTKKRMIVKDSKEEKIFVNNLIKAIKDIDTSVLSKVNSLENAVSLIAHAIDESWEKNSKIINISKLSKSWWDINYSRDLEKYRSNKHIKDWKQFKKTVKYTK